MTNASSRDVITPLVDAALLNLFSVRLRLGHFDPPSATPWGNYGLEKVDTDANRALAFDAALQGFVLLKHENSALPLGRKGKLAVLGPHATATGAMLGNYHERATPPGVLQSPCDGLKAAAAAASQVSCVVPQGCKVGVTNVSCFDDDARVAVAGADAVVVFIGLDGGQEAEGHDKTSLRLPGTQQELIDNVTTATAGQKPVIVVILSGSAVDLSALKTNPGVHAIVWAGYPGQAGGAALATALFASTDALGMPANRWGKLPMTWYDEKFCAAANLSDYRMRPDNATGYPGRTHRFFVGEPVYRFGDGLSLTSFEHSAVWDTVNMGHRSWDTAPGPSGVVNVTVGGSASGERTVAVVSVQTSNVGTLAGDEVVMLFVLPPHAAVTAGAPRQQLAAFKRLSIPAGGSARSTFEIKERHLITTHPEAIEAAGVSSAPWRIRVNHGSERAGEELEFAVHRAQ
jgi:hypothetical protein